MIVQCGHCSHVYPLDSGRDILHVFSEEYDFDYVRCLCPSCEYKGNLWLTQVQVRQLLGDGFTHMLHPGWVPMIIQGYAVKQREANAKRNIPIAGGSVSYD